MNMKQGTELIAKQAFTMKVPGAKGRPVSVKIDDKFWVTTPKYSNNTHVKIDRVGKGTIGNGHYVDLEALNCLFITEEE
jgi:hypothetical protein